MTYSSKLRTLLFFLLLNAAALSAGATEVLLKEQCRCERPTVKLGDLADVYDVDVPKAVRLAGIELFPAPTERRSVDLDEVQRLLRARGVNLADCLFGGAASVEVLGGVAVLGGGDSQIAATAFRPGYDPTRVRLARQRVEEAVLAYLRQRVDSNRKWQVKLDLGDEQADVVSQRYSRLSVEGGSDPWVGRQQFQVSVTAGRSAQTLLVAAHVTLPEMVVVARRPLRRGDTVQEGDVELSPAPLNAQAQQVVYSLDEVVGQEMLRAVSTGQPIDARDAQPPRLVKRNDVVTVYSLASGVRVRMLGKALEDGSLGDVITVADVTSRQPLRARARVTAFQTVEIYALGPQSAPAAPTDDAVTTPRTAEGENKPAGR